MSRKKRQNNNLFLTNVLPIEKVANHLNKYKKTQLHMMEFYPSGVMKANFINNKGVEYQFRYWFNGEKYI